jgi:hypothetical protein
MVRVRVRMSSGTEELVVDGVELGVGGESVVALQEDVAHLCRVVVTRVSFRRHTLARTRLTNAT